MMYASARHPGEPDAPGHGTVDVPLRLVGPPSQVADVSPHREIVDLYEREYVGMARLAYLLVGDRHLAEDLAHDAFARLYERWTDTQNEAHDVRNAAAFLRTIVTNLAMSTHRRRATARRHAGRDLDGDRGRAASAETEALGRSANPDIMSALRSLSGQQRTAVVLKHWLGLTESEIASTMDCSIGTVRTHLHRGHSALAARLGAHHA